MWRASVLDEKRLWHLVVLSIEAYSSLTDGVEAALDAADRYAEENDRRYSHEEVFSNLRRRING